MTVVAAIMARSYTPEMFDDLDLPPHVREYDKRSGVTTLTFDGDLDEATVVTVCDRMRSRNDTEQAALASLRAKRDAVVGDDPISVAVRAAINFQLGDTAAP